MRKLLLLPFFLDLARNILALTFITIILQVGLQHKPACLKVKAANLVRVNLVKDQVCHILAKTCSTFFLSFFQTQT